jgi:hypothetical protein
LVLRVSPDRTLVELLKLSPDRRIQLQVLSLAVRGRE